MVHHAGSWPQARWLGILAAIFVLALAPRAVAAWHFSDPPTFGNDAGWYDFFGQQIAAGHGYSLPYDAPTAACHRDIRSSWAAYTG